MKKWWLAGLIHLLSFGCDGDEVDPCLGVDAGARPADAGIVIDYGIDFGCGARDR